MDIDPIAVPVVVIFKSLQWCTLRITYGILIAKQVSYELTLLSWSRIA